MLEVIAEARRYCELLGAGGGYIPARPTCSSPMCRRKIFWRFIACKAPSKVKQKCCERLKPNNSLMGWDRNEVVQLRGHH